MAFLHREVFPTNRLNYYNKGSTLFFREICARNFVHFHLSWFVSSVEARFPQNFSASSSWYPAVLAQGNKVLEEDEEGGMGTETEVNVPPLRRSMGSFA